LRLPPRARRVGRFDRGGVGLLIADEVVDIFLPVRFYWVRRARWLKLQEERAAKEKATAAAPPPLEAVPAAL